uniref:Smr domain-containing protein C11H11.03c n=1 Tax=Lygus hesperus TaxID=30085 RepID=A0A0A9YGZ1_LYGHE
MAMLSLAYEQNKRNPISILDLHGFHVVEAVELLQRRVRTCQRQGIANLRVIVGTGLHSKKGVSVLGPAILEAVQGDPTLRAQVRVCAVKPAYLKLRLTQPSEM